MKKRVFALLLFFLLLSHLILPCAAVESPKLVDSKTALVYCIESNTVLYQKGIDETVYPAALVKLMTAVVAYENMEAAGLSLDSVITVSRRVYDAAAGNTIGLKVGEQLRLRDLMGAMMVAGANDAALAVSEAVGGSFEGFVAMMNDKAAELGMTKTYYGNATGIHHGEMVTTPRDLLTLAAYACRIPYVTELGATLRILIPATNLSEERSYGTRNYLISDRVSTRYFLPMATGLICGSTVEAGYCAIATGQHDGLNYIAIVTGAGYTEELVEPGHPETDESGNIVYGTDGAPVIVPPVRENILNGLVDARGLLIWAEENFGYTKLVDRFTPVVQVPVTLGKDTDTVTLMPERAIELFVPNDIDRSRDVTLKWELTAEKLEAPVKAGTQVGTLTVFYLGEEVGTVPLIVRNTIERSGGLTLLALCRELMTTPLFLLIFGLIAFAAVFYVFSTAIKRQKRKEAARREFEKKKKRYLK